MHIKETIFFVNEHSQTMFLGMVAGLNVGYSYEPSSYPGFKLLNTNNKTFVLT